MGVSRAAILTLAHCQQTELFRTIKQMRAAGLKVSQIARQLGLCGRRIDSDLGLEAFTRILAGGKVDQAHLRELSQDTGSSWRSARVCAKTATLREVK